MKKKYMAYMLGISLSAAQLGALPVMADTAVTNTAEAETQTQRSDSESASTEKSDAEAGEKPEGTPPAKPDGENGEKPEGTPPAKPDGASGEKPEGTPPAMPDGEAPGQPGGPGQGMPGGQSGVDSYEAANRYSEDTAISGEEITSTGTDENTILVEDEKVSVSISDSTITRNSEESSGGDNASFYGVGAAALATDGTLTVSDSTITTDAKGGAGLFAYGSGTVYAMNDTITTKQDTAGGIHVAGGGTLYAWDLNVTTQGASSAAIRSDRGSGTMVVDGGSYTSNGVGSPAIYSTADISVNDATLTANGSEAICIEGLNTIRLFNSDLTGNMSDSDQNDVTWNVIVYQSMSGDSEVGNGTFEMSGGTLTAKNGGMFYTTNTESTFILNNVEITPADENDFFLQVTGNSNARGWGTAGDNGAKCTFTGIHQTMEGDVIWDSISELNMYLTEGSTLTGAVRQDETWAGNGGNGYANLVIDESSGWIVTGDSTVTSLACAGTIQDADGNSVTIVGTDGTVYVSGDSEYTITVNSYSDTADTTQAGVSSDWENIKAEKPAS